MNHSDIDKLSAQPETAAASPWQSKIFPFGQCLDFMAYAGKGIYGRKFRLLAEDHEIIFKLLVYFLHDQENAAKLGIDLHKGVLLTGPVGCGKTALMTMLSQLLDESRRFVVKATRDICLTFIQDGYAVINKYSRSSHYLRSGAYVPRTYCFDDLGVESNIRYYGNDTNVMAEIMLSRYDLFITQGMLTHATTNLNANELEGIYGNRVRSRMREMFNLLSFAHDASDKRM